MKRGMILAGNIIALGSVSTYIAKKDGIKELLICVSFAIIAVIADKLVDRFFKRLQQ